MKYVKRAPALIGLAVLAFTGPAAWLAVGAHAALNALGTFIGKRTLLAEEYPGPRRLTTEVYATLVFLPLAGLLATWLTVAGTILLDGYGADAERFGWTLLLLAAILPIEIMILIATFMKSSSPRPFDSDEAPSNAIIALTSDRAKYRPLVFASRMKTATRWSNAQALGVDHAPTGALTPGRWELMRHLWRDATGCDRVLGIALVALNFTSTGLFSWVAAPEAGWKFLLFAASVSAFLYTAAGIGAYVEDARAAARYLLRVRSRVAHLKHVETSSQVVREPRIADAPEDDWEDLLFRALRAFQGDSAR